MTQDASLLDRLLQAIASRDDPTVDRLLQDEPQLARSVIGQAGHAGAREYFLPDIHLQIYAGDTALHVAAAAYRPDVAGRLIALGADIRGRNRRGAGPLHSATVGAPGSDHWNPGAQAETIAFLIAKGADPNAVDKNGVTPLHRAIRNRCAAAVKALLEGGADVRLPNGNGSTAMALATHTTGRGGTGTPPARAQQAEIVCLLEQALGI